ncbi:hypothetical protein LINPERHAP1_LOCUS8217 [Linum perenne]
MRECEIELRVNMGGRRANETAVQKAVHRKFVDWFATRKSISRGEKIVVELPDEGILPVGHLLSFMGQHCGECGRNWSFYPVSAVDWKKQDKRLKDTAWRNLALHIYHIEPRDLEPFRRVWEMKVGQSWSKSRLRLWEKLVKETRATGKDEDWIKSSNQRGITLNDWIIYMSYVYGEEFQVYGSMRGRSESSSSSAASISSVASSSIAPSRDEFNKLLETVQQLVTHMASSQGSATQPPAY